jgi:hypothetical protein
VWAKLRSPLAREWESTKGERGYYNTAPGKHVGDTVWRAAVLSQVRKGQGEGTVEILHDISKAFDRVPLRALAEHAERGGYPLTLACMSIGAYRWARHISDGVLVGAPLRPRAQGIIAGSAPLSGALTASEEARLRKNGRSPRTRMRSADASPSRGRWQRPAVRDLAGGGEGGYWLVHQWWSPPSVAASVCLLSPSDTGS